VTVAHARARPWVVVQHVAHEGPGLLGEVLDKASIEWSTCRVDQGDALPSTADLAALGGLVVMGGPMGVGDETAFEWLEPERHLLAAAVDAGLTTLGVCLGAQQLAAALGARVRRGPVPEVGPGVVHLSPAGKRDPVLGPAGSPLHCVHWHDDTFDLPGGATLLASNDSFEHQAFRVGRRAYGFQFHLEVDAALAASWAPALPESSHIDAGVVDEVGTTGRGVLKRLVTLATPD
jgi:GMP synthase (glutamine-hydrolysing)